MDQSRWRWSNFPIPEVYVVLLVAGIPAHLFLPVTVFPASWMGHAVGWPALLAGLLLTAWAVRTTAGMDIANPAAVITSGPYRFTRNPMYLGWTLISLGMGLIANSAWILMLLPLALIFTHAVIIPNEERALEERFGPSYLEYKQRVRRWI